MATLAAYRNPLASLSLFKGFFETKQDVAPVRSPLPHESASFSHALAALAAKLAVVDGAVSKAEYHAFEALFIDARTDGTRMRSQFVKHLEDRSTALQFARQVTTMTGGDLAIRRALLQRLISVATADAALNAAEMELLRVIADAFGIEREDFRLLIAAHRVPTTSPYDVLGVSSHISDEDLRTRYMAQVQKLHPDRYLAAGASADTVAMLSDQLATLNAAYKQVRALRAKKNASLFGRRTMKGAKAAA